VPIILLSIDQIMDREKRDMYFIDFNVGSLDKTPAKTAARTRHFAWFKANGLAYQAAAPRGWLWGNPGIYAVYFDSTDDPRVADYTTLFEDASGTSVDPSAYQMSLIPYQSWLDHGGPARLASDLNDDDP